MPGFLADPFAALVIGLLVNRFVVDAMAAAAEGMGP